MNMENMDRGLSQFQPEKSGEETELGSPEEKVGNWIEQYTQTHQPGEPDPYELPVGVSAWFTDYKTREEGSRQGLSRAEWTKVNAELQAEYKERLQQGEYQLFELRQAAEPDTNRIQQLERKLREASEENWWIEHQNEVSPRNILSHFEETATAIAELEGLPWATNQLRDNFSLVGALQYIENHKNNAESVKYEIYGEGGLNRWMVTGDGTVLLMKNFSSRIVEKAARRGFKMWDLGPVTE